MTTTMTIEAVIEGETGIGAMMMTGVEGAVTMTIGAAVDEGIAIERMTMTEGGEEAAMIRAKAKEKTRKKARMRRKGKAREKV